MKKRRSDRKKVPVSIRYGSIDQIHRIYTVLLILSLFVSTMISGLAVGMYTQNTSLQEYENTSGSTHISSNHPFARGSGTLEDPYMIYNVHDLQNMSKDLSAHYALANDIDASETSGWNDGAGFEPIGDLDNRFTGSLDGLNHIISGLHINRGRINGVGLFGGVGSGGAISNVAVVDASVNGNRNVGGLVGRNRGKVENSHVTGNVNGNERVGGLVGWNRGTVENSHVTGNMNGNERVGGLVGWNDGTVSNCYTNGSVTGDGSVGGLIGYISYPTIPFMPSPSPSPESVVFNSHYNIDTVLINGGHHVTIGGLFDEQYNDWFSNGLTLEITDYSDTLVPSNGYYEIDRMRGLRDLLGFTYVEEYNFRLGADIDLSTVSGLYIPYITTVFDGNNHTISNLHIEMPFSSNIAMFGYIYGGSISNIGLKDVNITGENAVGGLVGYNIKGTVENSFATGNVSGNDYLGGLVGYNLISTMNNTYSTGSVSGGGYIGGLLGVNCISTLSNSYSTGSVSGNEHVGEFVGRNYGGTVSNSFWDNETSSQSTSASGEGKTTTEMKDINTYLNAGWDIVAVSNPDDSNPDYTWNIVDGESYPFLSWEHEPSSGSPWRILLLIAAIVIALAAVLFMMKRKPREEEAQDEEPSTQDDEPLMEELNLPDLLDGY